MKDFETLGQFFDWFDSLTRARRLEFRAKLIGYIEATCKADEMAERQREKECYDDDDNETIRRTPDGMTPEEWMRELAEEGNAKLKRINAKLKEAINEAN